MSRGESSMVRFPGDCMPGTVRYLMLGDLPPDEVDGEFRPVGDVLVPPGIELTYAARTPARIEELPEVDGLDLCDVGDEDLPVIARMTGLRDLTLSGGFTDAGLTLLRDLRNLETLELWSDQMTGDFPFPAAPLLTVRLFGAELTDAVFGRVAVLPLAVLVVEGGKVTGTGLDPLRRVPDLGYVRVTGPLLDQTRLLKLARSPRLRTLSLSGLSDAGAVLPLAPPLREVLLDVVPRAACARLLFAGLTVNGLSAPPDLADAYARMLGQGKATAAPAKIVGARELSLLVRQPKPVLVDFTSPACPASKRVRSAVERVLAEYGGDLNGATVDVSLTPEVALSSGVTEAPTVVLAQGGREVLRMSRPTDTELIRGVVGALELTTREAAY